jgi:hypothetical protein
MYADDTTLNINGKNIFEIEATLNEDLNSVNMWCTHNNMVINPYISILLSNNCCLGVKNGASRIILAALFVIL